MKYNFLIICLCIFSISCFSQRIEKSDICYKNAIFTSYYSLTTKSPVYVVYKLYKGGGNTSRKGMTFTGNIPHFPYYKSTYDKGHLVPAEDFAYNYTLLKLTFTYYNCIPQTPRLNRGQWKVYETKIRKLSQTDSLLIVCGGSNFDSSGVPSVCWKVWFSLSTHQQIGSIVLNQQGGIIKQNFNIITFKDAQQLYNSNKQ